MNKIITILTFMSVLVSGEVLAFDNRLKENTYDGMINQDVIGRIFYNDIYVLRVFKDGAYHLARRSQNSGNESVALASGFQCFSGELKHAQHNGSDNSTVIHIYKDSKPIECSIEGFTNGSINKKILPPKVVQQIINGYKITGKDKLKHF